ncbi:MAG: GAF domain-containing protein [Deltaproteobacteria bacterium]|nr:GAF domain-containing protein [Deltaproteobacteria bacterium]
MDASQEHLEALISISTEITSTLHLDEVLQRVVAHACRLMEAQVASLLLVDKEAGTLRPTVTYGASPAYLAQPDRELASSLTGEVVRSGRPLYIPDVRKESRASVSELARQEGLCTLLSVPLRTKTEVIGVLNVYTSELRHFDEEEVRLLTLLANQSAIAIENATLHRDEMEAREHLRQSEKLASLGKLSAGLAHEIRNPLNTVSMLMYAMAQELPSDGPLGADVHVMQGELRRMSLLLEQFLEFARPRPPHFQREPVDEIMEETLLLIGPEARAHGVMVYKEWAKPLPKVWVDGAQIKQVFLNLLLNALQAMPTGGKLTVRIHVSSGGLLTAISDEGEGIQPEVRANLFQPFFTTKQGGTGLGLSISQRIIEGHNGRLRLFSQPGAGTTVIVRLPL